MISNMNIALLHYSVPPIVGGVESVLAHQAELMLEAGHHVRVIAGRGAAWNKQIEFVQIPLIDSRNPEIQLVKLDLDAGRVPPAFAALVEKLIAELSSATEGVDVLIAHNVCSLNKNLALTEALYRLNGSAGFPRLILWHHDLAWTTPRYRDELHDSRPWDLLRISWPGVSHVAVSLLRQAELATLMGIAEAQINVIPNGMDIAKFFKLEPKTIELVKELNLLNASPLFLVPVRITPRKNLEMALRILSHLKHSFPNVALIVTGPLGPHNPANKEYFQKLLELRAQLGLEKIAHFMAEIVDEFLPDEMIPDFFNLSDALLLPSLEEGFGIPLLEAGLSHRPVFCTDLPPLMAIGLDDAYYFSPEDDPGKVAEMITRNLTDNTVFRFAARARQHYTWVQIYQEKIEPLLTAALAVPLKKED
jgi:glycosyltransferase involved in cell wall biosynthesis